MTSPVTAAMHAVVEVAGAERVERAPVRAKVAVRDHHGIIGE
jgi:hypothetical protein